MYPITPIPPSLIPSLLILTTISDKAYATLLQYAGTYPTGAAMALAYPSTGNYHFLTPLSLTHSHPFLLAHLQYTYITHITFPAHIF